MGETLKENSRNIVETLEEICGNTMDNDRKWLGNWGKHNIEGITIIITQKMKRTSFSNFACI